MLRLTLGLSIVSLAVMVGIDRAIGSRAEFLNAWSVVERLSGRPVSAGTSVVAARLGAFGELVVVLMSNLAVGVLLAGGVRWVSGLFR